MKLSTALIALLALVTAAPLAAQDLTLTNVRIIVGNGTVIDRGSIVVRGGKIASVSSGAPAATAGQVIDAKGMSAMPGFIDAHRHINTGPNEKAQMQAQLEAGYTTILSGGGPAEGNITLRDHIDSGAINGPRIIPSASLRLNQLTPESARAEIRKMAAMGIKFTGEISLTPKPGPTEQEMTVLRAVVDEGKKAGVIVLNPGCGACIGCGPGVSENTDQVTVSAINRNFQGRSGPGKLYLASPLTVAASAFAGYIKSYGTDT